MLFLKNKQKYVHNEQYSVLLQNSVYQPFLLSNPHNNFSRMIS